MNLSLFTTSSNALPIGNATAAAKVCGLILFLSVQMTIMAQTPCENGLAGQYPCDGLDLMSVRSFEEMGGVAPGNGNDCWGWAKDGREFVLFGRSDGTSIVEITDPVNPVMIANVPTASVPSLWRDIKVIGDFAYIVSEAGEHGLQIVHSLHVNVMGMCTRHACIRHAYACTLRGRYVQLMQRQRKSVASLKSRRVTISLALTSS